MNASLTTTSRFQATLIKCLLLPLVLTTAPGGLQAESQSSKEEAEEIVMLSPFEVSASGDQGYAANTTLAGTGDKADARNAELTTAIDAISAAIKNTPGLRFEPREIMLASADRTKTLIGKGGIVTSYAHFVIFSDFSDGMRPYQRVKQVRDLLTGLKISTATTKLLDGPVGLYIRQPSQYRAELLAKIFADLEVVKKGLGAEFEVFVSGLNSGVKMRTCSETDIELWLDYSFTIRSIRELEARKSDKK